MKFSPCGKCGSVHFNKKPTMSVMFPGKHWCGHCGSRVFKIKEAK